MIALFGGITLVLFIAFLVCLLVIRHLLTMCKSYENHVNTYENVEADYKTLVTSYKHLVQKLEAYKRIIDTYREG